MTLENMLQEAGHKPDKEERKAHAAQQALLAKVFNDSSTSSGFADPAAMFV